MPSMKQLLLSYLLVTALGCLPQLVVAQDTTWVQTFDFNDITKRRDKFLFPNDGQEYRKILMYYTLKCDPATTQDSYDCGEWDYSTHNLIYDHRGVLDSTRQTHPNFKIGNTTPDSAAYSLAPTYTYYQTTQQSIEQITTISLNTATVGTGTDLSAYPFHSAETAGKAQFLWRAAELNAAGLVVGNITGMQFDLSTLGSQLNNLRIKLKNSTRDSLTTTSYETNLTEVYFLHTAFTATGMQSLQFVNPFAWDGTSNLAVEISFDAAAGGTNTTVQATTTGWSSGIYSAGSDYCINLNPNGGADYVNLGKTAQIMGNAARTYEAWGYTRAFNDGGLFQAGPGGSTGHDFALRTSTTPNMWRGQFWGTPDFDVTLANSLNAWHHYAVTYNSSTMKIYYDGVLAGQKSFELETPEYDIRVGEWLGTFFNGMIDEFRVWNVALTQPQIRDWKDRAIDATHPQYTAFKANYSFNEGLGLVTADNSPVGQPNGILQNSAWWKRFSGNELFRNFAATDLRPNVTFEQGVYESALTDITVLDSTMNAPLQIVLYQNEGVAGQIADDSPLLPNIPTDTLVVWTANVYAYTYNNGVKVDSVWVNSDAVIYKQVREWYSPTSVYEIGRFITPYGIGLNLGDEGFRWMYDVTDYAILLRDSVDFAAGNQQELIDVKFALIHGTPPATVQRIRQIWDKGYASHSYAGLDNDTELSAKTFDILPTANKVKIKTRLSGHGHNSNTGNYPHCCEWKDNTHYLKVNGSTANTWHIWQNFDCADNPVFPQGGTWLGSREGWCPGDVVKENDFFVTNGVQNGTITLDYDITPVPSSNLGMGGGNYLMAMQLFEYSAPVYALDAEIYDIIRPNDWAYYSRKNPICFDPIITVRNSGNTNITSISFSYQVQGGTAETYTWTGNLSFGQKAEVVLPISGAGFWVGDTLQHRFIATITGVNGTADMYDGNNTAASGFKMPDIYNQNFRVTLKTNNYPADNYYTIRDINGDIIHSRDGFSANTTYNDTLLLAPGCYTLEFYDDQLDGLSYWAYTAQGTGYLRLRRIPTTTILKTFEPEFGRYIHYSFVISDDVVSIANPNVKATFGVYPNPNEGIFEVDVMGINTAYHISVFNLLGQCIAQQNGDAYQDNLSFDLSQAPPGVYTVVLHTADKVWTTKVIKK